MSGETDIKALLKTMSPKLNAGGYVFCTIGTISAIDASSIIGSFREEEGWTVILSKELADKLTYPYTYVAAWITLTVHSSLEAVGLTAAFAAALAKQAISCNVIAGYYHDHIFVDQKDADMAIDVLKQLSADNL
ncbi:ACT domain-containing protein [Mucilaginibacter sp.]|uniref:ACT domain-containing protein n=1 Tax=Mucilaginibacter sp. TaxID=1882438 RepID=UPI003D0D4FA6